MQSIVENAEFWDGETLACAKGLGLTLEDFDLNFFLIIFHKIFPLARFFFEVLQKKIFDITFCTNKINYFKKQLNDYKPEFDIVWNKMSDFEKKKITPSTVKRCTLDNVSSDKK